ncbi:MAG TPA: retropepsin-like aspartic protease [Nannocystaceae bacterium]|nr:retropepsin-like aspartic protease [Nannocystaceae bacterium]
MPNVSRVSRDCWRFQPVWIIALWALVSATSCLRIPDDLNEAEGGPASAPSTAAEVLARHVKALGGEEKLRKITERTVEARMVFFAEEGCEEDNESCFSKDEAGSFVLQSTANGRLYRRTVLREQVEERGYDGKIGWSLGGGVLRIDTADEAVISREDAQLHWYFGVAERGIETTLLPARKEGTKVLDGLTWRVSPKVPAKTFWFDRATGLLSMEIAEDGEGEQAQRQTITYDDYKAVDGVLVPFKVRVVSRTGEREQVVEFVTQRVSHGPVDKTRFAVPSLQQPKPVADAVLTELERAKTAAKAAPRDVAAQVAYARAAFAAAHWREAETAAEATLAVDPREPEALFTLARVHILLGELGPAAKALARARKAGVREEQVARQEAWIHLRKRDFPKLARSLDSVGAKVMAGRYRSFVGKPMTITGEPACVQSVPVVKASPLMVVKLEIAGKPTHAIVDTGAHELILSKKFAADTDVTVRAKSTLGEGGPEVGYAEVDKLAIGGVQISHVPVSVFDDATIAEMAGVESGEVGAVLGLYALADFLVTIDVPGKKFEMIVPGRRCEKERQQRLAAGKSVPFVLHETHYVYVLGKLADAEGLYLVNTGMRGADMTATQTAYAHAGIGAPPIRSDEAPMVKIASFGIGEVALKDLVSAFGYFDQSQTQDGFRLDGMLGLGALGRKPFSIDYQAQKIVFAP